MRLTRIVPIGVWALLPAVLLADHPSIAQFRVNADLVLVPFTVMDRKGAPVAGFTADHVEVFEDRKRRPIVAFGGQDEPGSIGIILDISGSMRTALPDAQAMVRQILQQAREHDEVFLLAVSSHPELLSGFTGDARTVTARVQSVEARGRTALVDGVMSAIARMSGSRRSRRALIVLSDGIENHSRIGKREVLRAALESDAQVHTVAFPEWSGYRKSTLLPVGEKGTQFLERMSSGTGGLHFEVNRREQAVSAAGRIGAAIRNQYVLGYAPVEGPPGVWRRIQVKSNLKNVRVAARSGYYTR